VRGTDWRLSPRTTFSVTRKKIPAAENGKTYKFHMYPGRGHGLQGEGRASYREHMARLFPRSKPPPETAVEQERGADADDTGRGVFAHGVSSIEEVLDRDEDLAGGHIREWDGPP
jgi:hypothetical protein